ncbi:MAG: type I methionyl aminopeptidase [Prevotellaceae bacterium]|jgi:methionyl aminopeptidase|nr:type I methionyl aminopeptidase [Prevotellaceae bacterium]
MIHLRSDDEIELLRENALLVSKTLAEVGKRIAPGVTTRELDRLAEAYIRDHGAAPAFLNYNGFPNTLCLSVNDVVVHGIPSDYRLREGDILSVDCGTYYKGYYGDSAYTFAVGEVDAAARQLMRVTKESLFKGIEQAVVGNRIGDIAAAVQGHAEPFNYGVVREMTGHALGRHLHEKPDVPNYGRRGNGKRLQNGMVICIEPMINEGTQEVFCDNDGWTLHTKDGKRSAHYELTVVVRKGQAEVLSTFAFIEGEGGMEASVI